MSSESLALIEWVDDGAGVVPVFYDRHQRLVDVLHDYVVDLAGLKRGQRGSDRAYRSTIDAVAYALLDWWRYLESVRLNWDQANDDTLCEYRKQAYAHVIKSGKGRRDERLAKRTVNVKLRWIYRFYVWAQANAVCLGRIGPDKPIRSTLTETKRDPIKKKKQRSEDEGWYPCCFPGVGGRAGGTQYFATADDKRKILALFAKTPDLFVAERNRLMMELTDRVGWRAGTLTALRCDHFTDEAFAQSSDAGLVVTPDIQKFSHHDNFEVPHALAGRIARFIETRKKWLTTHGWSEQQAKHRLFLNSRNGQPLGEKSISQLFGTAFRSIGVPAGKGAGHHSFRRKFGDETTQDDLKARRAFGMSTAVEDVLHSTARKLGQHSIVSQGPYQRAVVDGTRDAEPQRLRRQLQELESTLADKDVEIAALKREMMLKKQRNAKRGRPKQ